MQKTTLEDFLQAGEIHLGLLRELLFSAVFIPYNMGKQQIQVQADRGTKHILNLLHSELVRIDDEEASLQILRDADNGYPYGMNVLKMTALDTFVQKNHLQISRDTVGITVVCRQATIPTSEMIPGIYQRRASGETILKALEHAMEVRPERMIFQQNVLQR